MSIPDEEPLATLKVYMSSAHSTQIRDYKTVGYFSQFFLFQIFFAQPNFFFLKFLCSGASQLNLISLLLGFVFYLN